MRLKLATNSTVIPGHVLRDELGVGEFGRVWSAIGPGAVVKALKFIAVDWSDPDKALREYCGMRRIRDVRGAFLVPMTDIWLLDREGRVLNEEAMSLLDDHVTRSAAHFEKTLTAPITPPDHIVVAMELCERTLGEELKRQVQAGEQGIPIRELLSYVRDAARGLDFLHEDRHPPLYGGRETVSLSHGDVKPDNIMLTGGGAKLCDFTLAEALNATGEQLRKTMMKPAGTFLYMGPEVVRGERSEKSDLYSLAITYYQLRTNSLPFSEQSLSSVFQLQTAKENQDLDFRSLPDAERRVLLRATDNDPSKRYETCVAMIDALDLALLEGTGSLSGLAPSTPAPTKPAWPAIATAVAVAVLGVGGLFLLPRGGEESNLARFLQKLEEPDIASVGMALDRMDALPEALRFEHASLVVERLEQAAGEADPSRFESRRQLLEYLLHFSELVPELSEGNQQKLDSQVEHAYALLIALHRKAIDRINPIYTEVPSAEEVVEQIERTRKLSDRVVKVFTSPELGRLHRSLDLQQSRLAARQGTLPSDWNAPPPKEVVEPDRPTAEALTLLAEIAQMRSAEAWPPETPDAARGLLARLAVVDELGLIWENDRLRDTYNELFKRSPIPVEWYCDREISASLFGPGLFDRQRLDAIAMKLQGMRDAPTFNESLDKIDQLRGAESDWIVGAAARELEQLIERERLAHQLLSGEPGTLVSLIESWPERRADTREAALQTALDTSEARGEKGSERFAALLTLKDEFAEEPSPESGHLDRFEGVPFEVYADYVRGLRLTRLGGADDEAAAAFKAAYSTGKTAIAKTLWSPSRRAVAAQRLAQLVVRQCGGKVPTDSDFLGYDVVPPSARKTLSVYRRVSPGLAANSPEDHTRAEAVAVIAAIRSKNGLSRYQDAVHRAATKLLDKPVADERRGALLLAKGLTGDPARDAAGSAEALLEALKTLEHVFGDNSTNARKKVLEPIELAADAYRKASAGDSYTKQTLAEVYRLLAKNHVRLKSLDAGARSYKLHLRANGLSPTDEGLVEQGLALIFSSLWVKSDEQLEEIRRIGLRGIRSIDPVVNAGAKACLGMAAIGRSRQIVGDRPSRASQLKEAIGNLVAASNKLEARKDDPIIRNRLVSCLTVEATARVERSFYSESSKDDLERALIVAERATQLDPRRVEAWRAWGNAHEDLALYLSESLSTNYRLAVKQFKEANKLRLGSDNDIVDMDLIGVTLPTRADLVRCRMRWLQHGLYARRDRDEQAEKQIAALLKESEQTAKVVKAAAANESVRDDAAQLLFFLAQGLKTCEENARALDAAEACRKVADPDDPATGEVWCAASVFVARLEPDRARRQALAESVLANPNASSQSVWGAANLVAGDPIDWTTFQTKLFAAKPGSPNRTTQLKRMVATALLDRIDQAFEDGEVISTQELRRRLKQIVQDEGLEELPPRFKVQANLLQAHARLKEATQDFQDATVRSDAVDPLVKAVLAYGEALDAYTRQSLPEAEWRLLETEPNSWGDVDPLLRSKVKFEYDKTSRRRFSIWFLAHFILVDKSGRPPTGLVAEQLKELLSRHYHIAVELGDRNAIENSDVGAFVSKL